jgi:hypothetical protein
MKRIIAVLLFSFVSTAYALPNCPSELTARWHNCFGSYTFDNGSKYVGEWKEDKQHGQGATTYAEGDKYVGEYKDGEKHGQGTYTWAAAPNKGDKYVGENKDGKMHGQGTYTFANGETDKGYFMNDKYIPDICEEMGLVKGAESFGNCVVKLIDKL